MPQSATTRSLALWMIILLCMYQPNLSSWIKKVPSSYHTYLEPPWREDGSTFSSLQKEIRGMKDRLKQPEKGTDRSLLAIFPIDSTSSERLYRESTMYSLCYNSWTPEESKILCPFWGNTKHLSFLDAMSHNINNYRNKMLVMLYHGDMFLKQKRISTRSAETAFNAFYRHWISFSDAPMYTCNIPQLIPQVNWSLDFATRLQHWYWPRNPTCWWWSSMEFCATQQQFSSSLPSFWSNFPDYWFSRQRITSIWLNQPHGTGLTWNRQVETINKYFTTQRT